jgi:hypothetical protein
LPPPRSSRCRRWLPWRLSDRRVGWADEEGRATDFDESARGAGARRRGAAAGDGAAQSRIGEEGTRRRAVPSVPRDELRPGRGELNSWPLARSARARPMAPVSSLPRPHAGVLDAWLPASSTRAAAIFTRARGARHLATGELHLSCRELELWPPQAPRCGPNTGSSTPHCTGGPQQAAPRALAEKLIPAAPVHGSSLQHSERRTRTCG